MVRAPLRAALIAALAAPNALAADPAAAPAPPRAAAPWLDFSSAEAHFAARLPARPEEARSQVGPMEVRVFTATEGEGGAVYLVIYMGLDAVPDAEVGDPAAAIAGMGLQLAEKFDGKLVRDTPAEVTGGTGRDFLIETASGAQVAARVVYGRKRMYQLVALGAGALAAAEAGGFFASLRLLP
jgi:hypothetical protein